MPQILCFIIDKGVSLMQNVYLDPRAMDNYIFEKLLESGYAPELEEVQTITDIFIELLIQLQLADPIELENEEG